MSSSDRTILPVVLLHSKEPMGTPLGLLKEVSSSLGIGVRYCLFPILRNGRSVGPGAGESEGNPWLSTMGKSATDPISPSASGTKVSALYQSSLPALVSTKAGLRTRSPLLTPIMASPTPPSHPASAVSSATTLTSSGVESLSEYRPTRNKAYWSPTKGSPGSWSPISNLVGAGFRV